jgi:hypothetical protein
MNLGIGILKMNFYFIIAFYRYMIDSLIAVQIISATVNERFKYLAKNLENFSSNSDLSFNSSMI